MVIGNVTCPFSVTCEVGEGGETLPNFHSVKGSHGWRDAASGPNHDGGGGGVGSREHNTRRGCSFVRSPLPPEERSEGEGEGGGGMLLASHAAAV